MRVLPLATWSSGCFLCQYTRVGFTLRCSLQGVLAVEGLVMQSRATFPPEVARLIEPTRECGSIRLLFEVGGQLSLVSDHQPTSSGLRDRQVTPRSRADVRGPRRVAACDPGPPTTCASLPDRIQPTEFFGLQSSVEGLLVRFVATQE